MVLNAQLFDIVLVLVKNSVRSEFNMAGAMMTSSKFEIGFLAYEFWPVKYN
jgi:hypothetical protein